MLTTGGTVRTKRIMAAANRYYRKWFFLVLASTIVATSSGSRNLLSDVGRCIAGMTLFDVDGDRFLDREEFAQVQQHIGGCPSAQTTVLYDELANLCRNYDADDTCASQGIALVGTYPVAYTNTVCVELIRTVSNERCVTGTGQPFPPLLAAEEEVVEPMSSPGPWRTATYVVSGIATCLTICILVLAFKQRKQRRRTDDEGILLQGDPALGIASRSANDEDEDDIILCSAKVFDSSPAVGFRPECIPEEPSHCEDDEDEEMQHR